ncbi:MAG: helix-turn-helix transcriptional regulator [Prevotella sp.]|jgi:transcriptional regulator with XRE-family HTH domain|nr:helix-turn-helix transcriptional regulator [Prevotella sp.]MBQ7451573.1 helix-turn-helix transcriptional regulator [Prevotella sp.]MBR1557603.1 helix-turn-helix transcriptional regulator [Prevotella sp.]
MSEKVERLRKFFEEKGITQEQLAAKLGVDKAHVNKLLMGKKEFGKRTARTWSDLFGLSYSWLLTGEGEMETNSGTTKPDVPYAIYQELLDRYESVVRENEQLRARLAEYEPAEKRKLG